MNSRHILRGEDYADDGDGRDKGSEFSGKDVRAGKSLQQIQNFHLSSDEVEIQDGVERVYIDEYKDVGEGKLFKGQWNKKTGERDGVGV